MTFLLVDCVSNYFVWVLLQNGMNELITVFIWVEENFMEAMFLLVKKTAEPT